MAIRHTYIVAYIHRVLSGLLPNPDRLLVHAFDDQIKELTAIQPVSVQIYLFFRNIISTTRVLYIYSALAQNAGRARKKKKKSKTSKKERGQDQTE